MEIARSIAQTNMILTTHTALQQLVRRTMSSARPHVARPLADRAIAA